MFQRYIFIEEQCYIIVQKGKGMDKYRLISKGLAVGIILLFVGTCFIPVTAQYIEKPSLLTSSGHWLYVGGKGPGNYTRIQDAIDNASDGDTVFIFDDSSPYRETVVIDKTIRLIGENKNTTTIESNKTMHTITISVNQVNISGFTIRSSSNIAFIGIYIKSNFSMITGNIITDNYYNIFLINSSNNNISGNIIENSNTGIIFINESVKNTISRNNMLDNNACIVFTNKTSDNIITGNVLTNNSFGMLFFKKAQNNRVDGNIITNNNDDSILFSDSNDNFISKNIISHNNGNGINLQNSSNNTISHNRITNNTWCGIYTFGSTNNNNIIGNNIDYNTLGGIYVSNGPFNMNTISGNSFTGNKYAAINLIRSENNTITYNNFKKNKPNAFFLNSYNNMWNGNYWDRPRFLPKFIFGYIGIRWISWINIDWHPAQGPYDIPGIC